MLFSKSITGIPLEAIEWLGSVLRFEADAFSTQEEGRKVLADLLGVEVEKLEDVDVDLWPRFCWEITETASEVQLWLRDNGESFVFDEVLLFVRALIKKWMPAYVFSMTWAGVTTALLKGYGGFGGGWLVVTKDTESYDDTWSAAAQAVKAHK
jgi:hypothetical protein